MPSYRADAATGPAPFENCLVGLMPGLWAGCRANTRGGHGMGYLRMYANHIRAARGRRTVGRATGKEDGWWTGMGWCVGGAVEGRKRISRVLGHKTHFPARQWVPHTQLPKDNPNPERNPQTPSRSRDFSLFPLLPPPSPSPLLSFPSLAPLIKCKSTQRSSKSMAAPEMCG